MKMFDLTKEIKLEDNWQKKYRIIQIFVYLLFLLGSAYLAYLILFPSKSFVFFFRTPLASKNTIIEPRDLRNNLYRNGKITDGELVFDTAIAPSEGNFSKIKINLVLEKNSAPLEKGCEVAVKKSYRSFFYPDGDPVDKKVEELFNAQENEKDSFKFSSGSLLSYGKSVFIVDKNTASPIDNEITFQSMGFDWGDLIPASSEEISAYKRGKMFTIASPHPDGTILSEKESGKYYLIDNGKKREIKGSDIIQTYLKRSPVIVDERSLEIENKCDFKKDLTLFSESYSCSISIENMAELLGNDYQYRINLGPGIKIKEAGVVFQKSFNRDNWKLTLSDIKKKIISNYYGQQQ